MATIAKSTIFPQRGVVKVVWNTFTASGDVGSEEDLSAFPDVSIQINGLPGGTTTMVFEGSNEATSGFITLADPQGNALSFTADAIEQVLENTRFVRPRIDTATTGGLTGVEIIAIGHRQLA